jgi:phenylacetate-CoA ligase
MKVLSGRKDDYVATPDGRKIYDAIFAYTLKRGISQFRAVQTALDRIEISIIPNDDYSPELGEQYIRELQKQLGEAFRITFAIVETIERERSGKLRYFRNEINRPLDSVPQE